MLYLFFRIINNYGYKDSIKIFFYEFYYFIFLCDFISFKVVDEKTSSYIKPKGKKYDAPHIPTPYYFLHLIKELFIKRNIKKINLIDIGCGYCRPEKFFKKKFKTTFFGIELDKNIIQEVNQDRIKKLQIYNFNIRNLKKIKFFFNKCLSKTIVNIIFISDVAEIDLVNSIIKKLNKEHKIYLLMINIKYKYFYSKNFKIQNKIVFKDKSKNIIIASNTN